jgi:hypothetical protein
MDYVVDRRPGHGAMASNQANYANVLTNTLNNLENEGTVHISRTLVRDLLATICQRWA